MEFPEHPPRKTRVCLLYCVTLSTYSSVINRGLSPHHFFLEKKLIQSFQIINLLGIILVFQSKNPSDGFPACLQDSYSCACDCLQSPNLERHRKLKTSQECRGFCGVKIIRIKLIKCFIVEPILAAKFSYPLFLDIVGIQKNKQETWYQQHQIFELSTFVITHCTFVLQRCNFSALRRCRLKKYTSGEMRLTFIEEESQKVLASLLARR